MDRRHLLTRLCGFCVALIAAPLGTVLAGYGWSSSRPRRGEPVWRSAGPIKDLPSDVPKRIAMSFTAQDGWYQQTVERVYYVRATTGGTPLVLSARCTHLGCSVRWNSQSNDSFRCPCHGGVFDAEGRVVKGPPKEPLERPAVRLEGGELWIQIG